MTAPPHGISARCEIIDVHDGDTLTARVTYDVRVRLLDCWAPEVRGVEKEAGLRSRGVLAAMALGKKGTLFVPTQEAQRPDDVFSFGRVLGSVWIDGEDADVSSQMVDSGFATKTKTPRESLATSDSVTVNEERPLRVVLDADAFARLNCGETVKIDGIELAMEDAGSRAVVIIDP